MKKIAVFALLASLAGNVFAGEYNLTVTGRVVLLPAAKAPFECPAWRASFAYTNGAVAKTSNGVWMCLIAGTSGTSNGPQVKAQTTEGSAVWIPVLNTRRGGYSIKNMTANSQITYGKSLAVSATNGFAMDYKDAISAGEGWQGVVCAFGTNSYVNFGDNDAQ